MIVKLGKLPSVESFAESIGLDKHLAVQYQKVRRRWQNNLSRFSRKYGLKPDIGMRDIRTWTLIKGGDINEAVEREIEVWEQRNKRAQKYLFERADNWFSARINAQLSSGEPDDDYLAVELNSIWKNLTNQQKIDAIKNAKDIGADYVYDEQHGLGFDFGEFYSQVMKVVR